MFLGRWIIFFFTVPCLIFANWTHPSKNHILYLVQVDQVDKGIALYQKLKAENRSHDFSLLEQIGHILLNRGSKSPDEKCQLLSMYGASQAQSFDSMEIYRTGIGSRSPLTQMATIHFLRAIEDDRVENILSMAFASAYLPVRMEAALALAMRKSHRAVGLITSLMERLPPSMHTHFPKLFAMIGTADAMGALERLVSSSVLPVRLASFLAAAQFGRDDFLQEIRAGLTHTHPAEVETCVAAVGFLQDSHSIPLLKKLARAKSLHVQLAACRSLVQLGLQDYNQCIMTCAKKKNLFAIPLLIDIENSESLLSELAQDADISVRTHAALALLKKQDPRAVPVLMEILVQEKNKMGFKPVFSPGFSLDSWKIVPPYANHFETTGYDIASITLALQGQILQDALELPEPSFLRLAEYIFNKQRTELVPLVVYLLETLKSQGAIELLEKQSKKAGAPLIRTYCHLALYRLGKKEVHRNFLIKWVEEKKGFEMFSFRSTCSWEKQGGVRSFQLTPRETSHLLIETCIALAEEHDIEGLDILLCLMQKGNPENRYLLAGLLLKSIQ